MSFYSEIAWRNARGQIFSIATFILSQLTDKAFPGCIWDFDKFIEVMDGS
jgi:hypothetical protein